MQQTVFVASVYLIPVLIVEHRCNVFQGFWRGAADRGPLIATISARGNADGRVVGSNLRNALARHNVAHVDGPNWSNCR